MSIDIKSLVEKASTNVSLHKQMEIMKSNGVITDQEINAAWVEWGRRQKGLRLLSMATMIITNAIYGEPTQFKQVQEEAARGASHNTMFSLLNDFSMMCFENAWPYYGVLIVKKDGECPSGYLGWFRNIQSEMRSDEYMYLTDEGILKKLTADCYEKMPPNAHEICSAVTNYIYNNRI